MSNPHNYPQSGPGPSNYYPQPTHVYGTTSPISGTGQSPNYYQYPYPGGQPMNVPTHPSPHHQQPVSPRINGRGGYSHHSPSRGGHTQHFPQPVYPHHYGVHAPHPQHPSQPNPYALLHPQKYPQTYSPSYGYPPATYSPSWQSQPPNPLPRHIPAHPASPHAFPPSHHPPLSLQTLPSQTSIQQETPRHENSQMISPVKTNVTPINGSSTTSPNVHPTLSSPLPTSSPTVDNTPLPQPSSSSSSDSPKPVVSSPTETWAIWSRRPQDPSKAPGIIISPRARPPPRIILSAIETRTPPPTPPISPIVFAASPELTVDAHPRRRLSEKGDRVLVPAREEEEDENDVVHEQLLQTVNGHERIVVIDRRSESPAVDSSQTSSTVPSSAVTNADTTSTVPGSPVSTNTSVSLTLTGAALPLPLALPQSQPQIFEKVESEVMLKGEDLAKVDGVGPSTTTTMATATATSSTTAVTDVTPTVVPVTAAATIPPPKKTWAALFQTPSSSSPSNSSANSSSTTSTLIKNNLPTSSVVGISIPAAASLNHHGSSNVSVSPTKRNELLALLGGGPASASSSSSLAAGGGGGGGGVSSPNSFSSVAAAAAATSTGGGGGGTGTDVNMNKIKPRGLVNSGNMCFANSVLQVLVYCQPFHKLFAELGKLLPLPPTTTTTSGGGGGGGGGGDVGGGKENTTPLVNATIRFLKEYVGETAEKGKEKERQRNLRLTNGSGSGNVNGRGKGKERERENQAMLLLDEEGNGDWDGESFMPTYVYDAMKEKKRFENMRGGHQEDAEEFLGFYLDTLEEELLSILHSLTSPSPARNKPDGPKAVEEKEEPAPPPDDGWLEVGKRNRTVVTRTIKTAETPITRLFGGKFRSTLKAPSQKESAVIEEWRALRLDIQREHIHNIQDALAYISQPQPVQVTNPAKPGLTLEATQQVLIDSLPKILVLHLKRFCYDIAVGGVVKVGKQVRFGPELEIGSDVMAPAVRKPQPTRYKLFGVLYHHGLSASGGHYTLDVLHPNRYPSANPMAKPREGWVRIDDELVSDVVPEDVFGASERDDSRCAYLLFYRRLGV